MIPIGEWGWSQVLVVAILATAVALIVAACVAGARTPGRKGQYPGDSHSQRER